jgi:hypothetical protein
MTPVDPDASNSNLQALTLFTAHASAILLVISIVTRFLAKSSYSLPPSHNTHRHDKRHQRHIALFSALTVLSFLMTVYHAVIWRVASYTSWARAHRVNTPNTLWSGWYGSAQEEVGWQLGRWMRDVDLRAEADDALFGTSKAVWWTYQELVGIVTWSIFVGIDCELLPLYESGRAEGLTENVGRHRKIPLHVTLSFIALAQLAGLSVAQNLFFLTMAATRAPLDSGELITPQSYVFLVPALLSNAMTFYAPHLRTLTLWPTVSALAYFVIPLLLSLLAQPNSLHDVTTHADIHTARTSYMPIFRLLSWSSLSLNLYFGLAALLSTTPSHAPLTYQQIPPATHSTLLNQAYTTFTRILSLPSANPILGAVAWDVLLSTLSLCLWSSTRPLAPTNMLQSAGLLWTRDTTPSSAGAETPKRPKTPSKKATDAVPEQEDAIAGRGEASSSPATKRGRGRPRKADSLARASGAAAADAVVATPSPMKRRGKAKSAGQVEEDGGSVASAGARVAAKVPMGSDGVGELEGSEAGALAWGLWVVGGLGTVMSAVAGAEVAGGT